jgi:hypothetical protein
VDGKGIIDGCVPGSSAEVAGVEPFRLCFPLLRRSMLAVLEDIDYEASPSSLASHSSFLVGWSHVYFCWQQNNQGWGSFIEKVSFNRSGIPIFTVLSVTIER